MQRCQAMAPILISCMEPRSFLGIRSCTHDSICVTIVALIVPFLKSTDTIDRIYLFRCIASRLLLSLEFYEYLNTTEATDFIDTLFETALNPLESIIEPNIDAKKDLHTRLRPSCILTYILK